MSGEVHHISPFIEIKSIRKRELVLKVDEGQYPQFIKFEMMSDRGEQLNGLNPGDRVEVSFNIRGRKWQNPKGELVYFNTLDAWKVVPQNGSNNQMNTPAAPSNLHAPASTTQPSAYTELDDDLPF